MKLAWLIVPLISGFPIVLSAQTCAEKQLTCDTQCYKSVGDLDEGKLATCEKNCYQKAGCPEQEGPGTRPWDVISTADGTDPNGFLRNPIWAWQVYNPGPPFLDACNYCPCGAQGGVEIGGVPPGESWTADPTCTNQLVHRNQGLLGFSICEKGHMDWFPVAYEGMLRFEDHMVVIDSDYEWDIAPIHNNNALLTIGRSDLHTEFDSRETVDDWDGTGTWFDSFRHFVDGHNKQQIAASFGRKYALVIGMLGLDLYHGSGDHDHQSELHPVYAMFINLTPPSGLNTLSQTQHWAFFVRNWGNEGSCGPNDEPLDQYRHFSIRLPATQLTGANVWVATNDISIDGSSEDTCWQGSSMTNMASDGTIGFNLPGPSAQCSIVGDLITAGPPFNSTENSSPGASGASSPGPDVDENEPAMRAQFAKLSPGDLETLERQLQAMNPPRAKSLHARPIRRSNTLPQLSQTVAAEKRFVAVPNRAYQASEAKKRQVINDFLHEHELR